MKTVFITGGARSGKSSFALSMGDGAGGRKAYVATAEALDEEMAARIATHRKERDDSWETFEEPRDPAALGSRLKTSFDIIVIDCLTLWLSNVLVENAGNRAEEVEALAEGMLGT